MATTDPNSGSGSSDMGSNSGTGSHQSHGGGDSSGKDGSNGNDGTDSGSAGGPGGAGTNPSTKSLNDLKGVIKKWADAGASNLKLSTESKDAFTKTLADYRTYLQSVQKQMDTSASFGNVGTLMSAIQTRDNLLFDINGPGGAKEMVGKSIDYLNVLESAVNKAADAMIDDG